MRYVFASKFLSIGLIALAMGAATTRAQVIGNFETPSLDNFGTDGGAATVVNSRPLSYAQSSTGVTLNSHSLAVGSISGEFWGPATGNLVSEGFLAAMSTQPKLSYDLTMIGSAMFTGGNPSAGNFALSNELAVEISWSSGGALTTNGSTFLQQNASSTHGNATDSLVATQSDVGIWTGVDGTRTITWNFANFKMLVPGFNGNASASFQQFLQTFSTQITDLKIDFVQLIGDRSNDDDLDTPTGAYPGTMFWDNIQLIPEPASLGCLALMGLLALRRRQFSFRDVSARSESCRGWE
jgi:hypothetical protein